MSNDNNDDLKANHEPHSADQQPKQSRYSLIFYILIIACLFVLLLVTSCQPSNAQSFKSLEVINHV